MNDHYQNTEAKFSNTRAIKEFAPNGVPFIVDTWSTKKIQTEKKKHAFKTAYNHEFLITVPKFHNNLEVMAISILYPLLFFNK